MTANQLNEDFQDFLNSLCEEGVEFLVVGAYAVAAHGAPRATGDLDVLVRPTEANAAKLMSALARFGAPVEALGIKQGDFVRPGVVCQIGLPPRRIDVLTEISGVSFDEAWSDRVAQEVGGLGLFFLSREALIRNKRASGRPKDLADLDSPGRLRRTRVTARELTTTRRAFPTAEPHDRLAHAPGGAAPSVIGRSDRKERFGYSLSSGTAVSPKAWRRASSAPSRVAKTAMKRFL